MKRYRIALAAVVVVGLAGGLFVGQVLSQEAGAGRSGQPAARQRRFDPERMRQMYMERIKETLGATDEEWKVLGPKVEKVQGLSSELGGGMRMRMLRRSRTGERTRAPQGERPERPAGERGGEAERELTDVEKAVEKLRTTLDDKDADAGQVKDALKSLREAREKVKQELAKAQAELRELLTARQEAELVLMALLD